MDDNKNDQNSPTQNNLLGDNDRTTIGQYLRAKREKKNLTIKHIAQFTKINTTQVELLEKDLLHKLPNRAYVAGYVKAYAKAIGLSQDEALRYLDKTYRDQAPEVPAAPLKVEPKETAATAYVAPEEKQRKISKEAIVLMGVAGVMVAVTSLTLLFKKEPQKVVEKISPESEMQAQPTVTPTPMMTKIPVQTPTLAPKVITTLTPTFTPTQTPTKAPTIAPTPTAVPTVSEKSTSTQTIIKEQIKIFPDIEILNTQDQFSSPLQRPSEKKEENSSKVQEEPITKKEEIKEEKKDEKKDEKKKSNFFKIRIPLYQVLKNSDLSDKIPTNIRHAVAPGKQNVYITTGNGRTWITYKVDKEPIKQIFLKENAAVLLSGSEVRLFLGNAAAANVYLNNNPVDMQLKRGIKNLVFPESSISKFAVPLFIFDEQGTISPSDEYMKKKGLTPN